MNNSTPCPICKKPTKLNASNTHRPFCSKRCRMIDLGEWINESYSISDSTNSIDTSKFDNKDNVKH